MNFPEDADGDALRQLAMRTDMSKPTEIDFVVVAPNEDAAKLIATRVTKLNYSPSIEFDDENNEWACYCTKSMVPTYDAIIAARAELDGVSHDLDGYADGWGALGVSVESWE